MRKTRPSTGPFFADLWRETDMAHAKQAERPLSALDIIYGRRSVRAYVRKPLDASTIRGLLDAAVQAPTAVLEQPWLFAVVEDQRILALVSDHAKAAWLQEASKDAGPHLAGLHGAYLKRLDDPAFNIFYGAPALIVICARAGAPFFVADCWLAAENLMLAAAALGLGSCCIGAAVNALNAPDVKTLLRIPADVHAVVPIVVGVAARDAEPVARREPTIISWR